jgi:hypothetical protein
MDVHPHTKWSLCVSVAQIPRADVGLGQKEALHVLLDEKVIHSTPLDSATLNII